MAATQLMEFLKFDQADLAANRSGRFTSKQQERIVKQDKTKRLTTLIGGGVAMAVVLASLTFAIVFLIGNHDPTSGVEFGIAFGLVVPLVFGFFGVRSLWKALAPRQLRLASVEGPVTIKRTSRYDSDLNMNLVRVELQIRGRKFLVTPGLEKLLAQGGQYKLYYVDGTDTILSVEEIAKAS